MNLKMFSWNINGIRAIIKKGFWQTVQNLQPDIICVQEIKCSPEHIQNVLDEDVFAGSQDFGLVYHCANNRKGYSGTAIFYRKSIFSEIKTSCGIGNPEFDIEGRMSILQAKIGEESLVLLNGYYPQGGRGPERIEYKIRFYNEVFTLAQKYRQEGKKVILCGDFNTTVADIDLARPKENRKTTGCLPEERAALNLFLNNGYIDTFRHFYPDLPAKYTYWDQITRARERNVGWRIDYFLLDESFLPNLKSANTHDQIMGSDHCPVSLELVV